MEENWYPAENEYDPGITTEEWLKLLNNENIFDFNSMCMMKRLFDIGGSATCSELAKTYGKTASSYIAVVKSLAKRIIEKTGCKIPPQKEENNRRWPVLFVGRKVSETDGISGVYIWKLRPELQSAIEQTDLSKYPLYEEDSLYKFLVEAYKNILKENQKKAFDDELYKWQALSECNGKSAEEVFSYFLKNEGKNGAKNLFYYMGLSLLEPFVNEPDFKNIFENLFDENVSLDRRLEKYKNDVKNLISGENKILPNDERSASVFLACHDPQKYTFYKDSYYGKLCDFFNEPKQKAGQKYSHYLKLVGKFEKYIDSDSELLAIFKKLTSGYLQSKKLIVQNILYVMFEIFPERIREIKNMTDKSFALTDQLTDLLQHTHNLILHGAPGTGKTFLAKQIAKRMKCSLNEIGFVQFYPSYDYTDFVEGLRPKNQAGGEIGFERKDGIFKEFCKRALLAMNVSSISDNFEQVWEKVVDYLNEKDFMDIPLLPGKSTFRVELNENGDGLATRTYENGDYKKGEWIQGKSKFYNKEQLYNIYKGLPGISSRGHDNYRKAVIEYWKKNFGLVDYSVKEKSENESVKPFLFIIDEINRGELSKIFGELFFCIDPGYRGKNGMIKTQYQNLIENGDEFYDGFFLPENVYIIGTMNDIDRSVDTMDFAFRRRFAFKEIKASENLGMLDKLGEIADEAEIRIKKLNNAITEITELPSPSSYHIGGSYFLKLNDFEGDCNERFQKLWDYHLEGLLKEYLRSTENAEENFAKLEKAYFGLENSEIPDEEN